MKRNQQHAISSRGRLGRGLQWSVAVVAMAGLPLAQLACGEDKKASASGASGTNPTKPGGTTTNPNTTTPTPAEGGGAVEPTTTAVTLTTDSTTRKPVKQVTHAIISYDGTKLLGYSYDFCDWASKHSVADSANVKPPKNGEGAQFILNIGASPQLAPASNTIYTVKTNKTENNVSFDNNIYGVLQSDATCTLTSRGAATGTINWFTVTPDSVTATIDVTLAGWPDATATTLKGSIVAAKCPGAAGTSLNYADDTNACSSVTYN